MIDFAALLRATPTHCDSCGAPLTRSGAYSTEFQLQALPDGESLGGRPYIAVCSYGECLTPQGEVPR